MKEYIKKNIVKIIDIIYDAKLDDVDNLNEWYNKNLENRYYKNIEEITKIFISVIPKKQLSHYNLDYYIDLAKQLEAAGAHMLCIKDMAGLIKPYAAEVLIKALKQNVSIPIHLHTHDTSSIQSSTYLKAIEADVDVVDVALASMSGLTSQPNFNSIVAAFKGHERENPIDLQKLNEFSNYF